MAELGKLVKTSNRDAGTAFRGAVQSSGDGPQLGEAAVVEDQEDGQYRIYISQPGRGWVRQGEPPNIRLYVDNFGAVGDGKTDDSAAIQDTFDHLPARGGIIVLGPRKYRAKEIKPPKLVSYEVHGAGPTGAILSPPSGHAGACVFDLSESNGPAKLFRGFKIEGANFGKLESIGFTLHTTNGLMLRDMWLAGLRIGVDWRPPCSFLDAAGCVFEDCGQGWNFRGDPLEVLIRGATYYRNLQDLQVTGDCSTFRHSGTTSIGCTNTSVLARQAINFSISDFAISKALNAINVTQSNDATFSDGMLTGNVHDWITVGTTRIYARDVKANYAALDSRGIYVGTMIGGKRLVTSLGMPNSMYWSRGDRALERSPSLGAPRSWIRLTTGSENVAERDWASEGRL